MNGVNHTNVSTQGNGNHSETELYKLELSPETAEKFATILSEESLMHSGFVSHQANNNNFS